MRPPDRWLFFDVDQTLCDFDAMMRRALAASIDEIERQWPQLSGRYRVQDLIRIRDRIAADHTGPVPHAAVRRQMFAHALAGYADRDAVDRMTALFMRVRYADPIVFDDVRPAIDGLRAGLRIGVISNGNSAIGSLGLGAVVEREFTAARIGFAKPDPRIYRHVADAIDSAPSRLIMVGDSLTDDVLAARAAGWRGIWLRRDGARGPDAVTALTQLPGLLGQSRATSRPDSAEV